MSLDIWLHDAQGTRIGDLNSFEALVWARVVNASGWFEMVLPGDYDAAKLQVDGIVEIWRRPEGGNKYIEFSGFIRKLTFETDSDGVNRITIAGPDVNEIIERRIVAYASGTAYATHTDNSDDILKALVAENAGASATDADRSLVAAGLTIAADESDGPSQTFSCAWDELDGAVADLVDAASGAGTAIYWQVTPMGSGDYKLYTYTGQPGQDRTVDNVVVFGLEYGNLAKPKLVLDYTKEVTVVYAGGQGEGSLREIVEVEDTDRSGRSPWGRREAFIDARNESATAGVTAKAYGRLDAGKPRLIFTGILLSTAQAVYGTDWAFGDRVFVTYRGTQYEALVRAVTGKIDTSGNETIEAYCEVNDAITG